VSAKIRAKISVGRLSEMAIMVGSVLYGQELAMDQVLIVYT